MNAAITVFAWIGLGVSVLLTALTLFVWADWLWRRTLESATSMLGLFFATSFYCGVVMRGRDYDKAAAQVLLMRFRRLEEERPQIGKHFRKLLIESEVQGE